MPTLPSDVSTFVDSFLPKITSCSKTLARYDHELRKDLVQAGCIAVARAYETLKTKEILCVDAYVGTAIRNAMIRELKQSSIHAMEVRQSDLSLDQQNSNSLDGGRLALDDPYSWVVSESICEVVGEWADAGPSTRKKVLEHQIRGLTVTQSALEMGISHQAVSKHKRAINHFADSLR